MIIIYHMNLALHGHTHTQHIRTCWEWVNCLSRSVSFPKLSYEMTGSTWLNVSHDFNSFKQTEYYKWQYIWQRQWSKSKAATVVSGSKFTLLLLSDSCWDARVHTLMKSALVREEQWCPFLPTTSMNKSHHVALWNRHETGSQKPYRHLGWSWVRLCSRLPWSGWRCPNATCWWWSSR